MSAMAFAKQAFGREKPHSSTSEFIEILTSSNYEPETYDGIPELVESINIQATGPSEASRAIRKKIKHGTPHQQYRALHILKAVVENGGPKFHTSFADSQLTDALKHLAADPATDSKVKKKLTSVLAGWCRQFQDDPSMSYVAKLYDQCKLTHADRANAEKRAMGSINAGLSVGVDHAAEKRREEKKRAKEERDQRKREEAERKQKAARQPKRKPFNFEEERPQILTAIANASQAANNLVNAMTLVNTQQESLEENVRVQECLTKAKQVRKQIVRYIQLVENEDMIGVLIETNDRIIAALENYDMLSKPDNSEQQVKEIQEGLAAAKLSTSELGKLQERQREVIERSIGGRSNAIYPGSGGTSPTYVHPDLQDLQFGSLGADQKNLPPPIRPTARRSSSEEGSAWRRGSLSDYSDYISSDEEARASSSAGQRGYVDVSDNESSQDVRRHPKQALPQEEDPFADPFAD